MAASYRRSPLSAPIDLVGRPHAGALFLRVLRSEAQGGYGARPTHRQQGPPWSSRRSTAAVIDIARARRLSGVGETYEDVVEDEMDLRLLARIESVDWAGAGQVLDLACGTSRIGV